MNGDDDDNGDTNNNNNGIDDDDVDNATPVEAGVNVPYNKLSSDFGDAPYWNNGTIATDGESYMLSAIATYSNMDGLWSTPQYGFNRGISEFGKAGYDATVSELSDNLIGMNAEKMLNKKQITSDVCINALSYLMFLKRKRTSDIKARGCANRQPQREFISKEESSLPTVST